ncbi:unnamed protein product [Brachionus calyciflorus]|uniref:Uncharacterized protein n=1 Tax=Brachionus calyciflorus TaxID=104777 RepID=A0A813Q9J9_9BILA|nr:unnamed protein product [Brachionus calyciflorus]
MNSFLESSNLTNFNSPFKLADLSDKHLSKRNLRPLNNFEIEKVKLKYLNPRKNSKNDYFHDHKDKLKKLNVNLPRIQDKESKNVFCYGDINTALIDVSLQSLSSSNHCKKTSKKSTNSYKNICNSNSPNSGSHTSTNDIFSEQEFCVSIENFKLQSKSKQNSNSGNFLYKLNDDSQFQNQDSETQFRLKSLKLNETQDHKQQRIEPIKKIKSRKRSVSRKAKIKENKTVQSYNTMNNSLEKFEMIRVDSPHLLRKSIPNDYKFVSHSSVFIGFNSKELTEQFEYFQSNNFSNREISSSPKELK